MVAEESVLLLAASGTADDASKEALTNIAMQVAAMSPQYISEQTFLMWKLAKIREITG